MRVLGSFCVGGTLDRSLLPLTRCNDTRPSFAQEAVVEELRGEMQKLANYKAAQQKLAGMETLGDEPKRAQVGEWSVKSVNQGVYVDDARIKNAESHSRNEGSHHICF